MDITEQQVPINNVTDVNLQQKQQDFKEIIKKKTIFDSNRKV
jgi:hypothetical protein